MWFTEVYNQLQSTPALVFFIIAILIAFGFEFINGFHDTANAVTTVIYTRTLQPTPAVIYSGFLNFLGVLFGGTAVAFSIVNLLPVDLLIDAKSSRALVMVLSLLIAGVIWNLGTWYYGLPVSSSHTLIGSIVGVGIAHGILSGWKLDTVGWSSVTKAGIALLISPLAGFIGAAIMLLVLKRILTDKRLYEPPQGDDKPPNWVRGILILTCGGVSFFHGSNDGQKGMGLILLVLVGFLPAMYSLNTNNPDELAAVQLVLPQAKELLADRIEAEPKLKEAFRFMDEELAGKSSYTDIPSEDRWKVRLAIYEIDKYIQKVQKQKSTDEQKAKSKTAADVGKVFKRSIEFVPFWVVVGVALALGIGTTIGYKRIVVTVAEKIGKSHLTYGQGAVAETVAALTILGADVLSAPVSTTQILNGGIAGTMAANGNGVQAVTVKKILLAWIFTLPCTMLMSGIFFAIGSLFV
jgi:inorganic phosphate transporter, PiT family